MCRCEAKPEMHPFARPVQCKFWARDVNLHNLNTFLSLQDMPDDIERRFDTLP